MSNQDFRLLLSGKLNIGKTIGDINKQLKQIEKAIKPLKLKGTLDGSIKNEIQQLQARLGKLNVDINIEQGALKTLEAFNQKVQGQIKDVDVGIGLNETDVSKLKKEMARIKEQLNSIDDDDDTKILKNKKREIERQIEGYKEVNNELKNRIKETRKLNNELKKEALKQYDENWGTKPLFRQVRQHGIRRPREGEQFYEEFKQLPRGVQSYFKGAKSDGVPFDVGAQELKFNDMNKFMSEVEGSYKSYHNTRNQIISNYEKLFEKDNEQIKRYQKQINEQTDLIKQATEERKKINEELKKPKTIKEEKFGTQKPSDTLSVDDGDSIEREEVRYKNIQDRVKEIKKSANDISKISVRTGKDIDDIQQSTITYTDALGRQVKETYKLFNQVQPDGGIKGMTDGDNTKYAKEWVRSGYDFDDNLKQQADNIKRVNERKQSMIDRLEKLNSTGRVTKKTYDEMFKNINTKNTVEELKDVGRELGKIQNQVNKTKKREPLQQELQSMQRMVKDGTLSLPKNNLLSNLTNDLKKADTDKEIDKISRSINRLKGTLSGREKLFLDVEKFRAKNILPDNEISELRERIRKAQSPEQIKKIEKDRDSLLIREQDIKNLDAFNKSKEKLTNQINEFAKSGSSSKKEIAQLNQELNKATDNKGLENIGNTFEQMQSQAKNAQSLATQTERVSKEKKKLTDELEVLNSKGKITSQRFHEITKEINRMSTVRGVKDLRNQFNELNLTPAQKQLETAKVSMQKKLRDLARSGQFTTNELKQIGTGIYSADKIAQLDKFERKIKDLKSTISKSSGVTSQQDLDIFKQQAELNAQNIKRTHGTTVDNKALDDYLQKVNRLRTDTPDLKNKMRQLGMEFKQVSANAKDMSGALQSSGMSITEMMRTALVKFPIWMASATIFYQPIRIGQDLVRTLIDINTQMTTLSRVTGGQADIEKTLQNSFEIADRLGNKLQEVNEAMIG